MNKIKNLLLSVAAIASFSNAANAAEDLANAKSYITGYIGYFDIIRNDYNTTQLGVEYRHKPFQYGVRPVVGFNFTKDESVYGYAGINWDIPLIDNQLYVIPNFVAGIYKRGDGKELGGPLEFRSGLELAYQFPNYHRLGLSFNHISNASIYKHNPGSEALLLTYSVSTDSWK